MPQVTQLVGCKTEPWSWQAMPSTERGGESSVPPRTLPADQGLGLLGWRPSYIPGSPHGKGGRVRFIFPPQRPLSFPAVLVCLGCLPAHPSASSQAWNFRMLRKSKREVGVEPSQRLLQAHFALGLGPPGTQSEKPVARGHMGQDEENICSESQQTQKDGGVFIRDHCAWGASGEQRAL